MDTLVGRAWFMSCPAWACGERAPKQDQGGRRGLPKKVWPDRQVPPMPGIHQDYTSICREDAHYLNTELALPGFQTDSHAEKLDPAQACLRLLPSSPLQAKTVTR